MKTWSIEKETKCSKLVICGAWERFWKIGVTAAQAAGASKLVSSILRAANIGYRVLDSVTITSKP